MLAQNFKTAAELGLNDVQLDALQKTLVLFETGKVVFATEIFVGLCAVEQSSEFTGHFNMANWSARGKCGTVGCIGGTAEMIGGLPINSLNDASNYNYALENLFYANDAKVRLEKITVEQAARALRNYLTTGHANWAQATAAE
jgi:hypothetical protein